MRATKKRISEEYALEEGAEVVDHVEAVEEVGPHAPEAHREKEGDGRSL